MKTKLFLFIAVLIASFSVTAQVQYNSIAIVGAGVGGWPGDPGNPGPVDVHQLTRTPGTDTWVIENLVVSGPGFKLRANNSWANANDTPPGGNWGRPSSGSQFPTGIAENNTGNFDTGIIAGTYTLTFNSVTWEYSFSGGAPISVVKIVGTSVATAGGESMITSNGNLYTLTTTLTAGSFQFELDGIPNGGLTFPNGTADDPSAQVPVTAGTWVITIDVSSGNYTFTTYVSPLVNISILGAATPIGWSPTAVQEDTQKLNNKDDANENYYLPELALTVENCKFRTNKDWDNFPSYGGTSFPMGPVAGDNSDIAVTTAGTYSVSFKRSTKAYSFFAPTVGIIGAAIGGWDDANEINMTTTDNITFTKMGVVVSNGPCKFRLDNRWVKSWGSSSFPSGTAATSGQPDIPATAGTYNVTFNRLTGAFTFADALATTSFQSLGFSVSPNPTNSAWSFNASKDAIANIQIVDLLGKVVVNTTSTTVDASALTTGIYFAKVNTANATATVKVIKN